MLEYESFCVYGFNTAYPSTWKVEFDPKSDRTMGNVAFKSPERNNIVLSWGPLERAKKKYSSVEEHAEDSIKGVRKNPSVARVEIIQKKELDIPPHKAIYSILRVVFASPSMIPFKKGKEDVLEMRSIHVHCEVSDRYYVIFGQIAPSKSEEHGEIFSKITESFKCHS